MSHPLIMMSPMKETPLSEDTPTPPSKPHRQILVVFDLTSPAHRDIVRLVARNLRLTGQADKAATLYEYLDSSAEVVEASLTPEELDVAPPAAVAAYAERFGQAHTEAGAHEAEGDYWATYFTEEALHAWPVPHLEGGPDAA